MTPYGSQSEDRVADGRSAGADQHVPFSSHWKAFWRQLAIRRHSIYQDALSQSLGVLLISLGLLTVSALSARTAWLSMDNYYRAVNTHIQKSLAPSEPRSDVNYPAVIGSVLAPINSALQSKLPDRRADADQREINNFLMAFHTLAAHSLLAMGPHRQTGVPDDGNYVRRKLDLWQGTLWEEDWLKRAAETHAVVLGSPPPPYLVHELASYKDLPERARGQGAILVDRPRPDRVRVSTLQVPSHVVKESEGESVGPNQQGELVGKPTKEVDLAARVALFLDESLEYMKAKHSGSYSVDSSGIVQAYFISESGVLRIHPAHDPVRDLPTHRYWPSAHYFQRFYQAANAHETDYHSPPYLDVGQQGLVRTWARVIPAYNREDSSGVFGVVAVDYRIPVDVFLDSLAKINTLFHLHRLQLPSNVGLEAAESTPTRLRKADPATGRYYRQGTLWKDVEDKDLLTAVQQYGRGRKEAEQRRTLGVLSALPPQRFILPLAGNDRGQSEYLILTAATPHVPSDTYFYLGLAFVSLALTTGLIVHWHRQAATRAYRFGVDSFLRNLPVGIVEVEKSGRIAHANTAAEWLLSTTLPQYGERDEDLREDRPFADLIYPYVFPLEHDALGNVVVRAAMPFEKTVSEERAALMASSYCVVVRETLRVLRISGGVVLEGVRSRKPRPPRRAGVVLPVSKAVRYLVLQELRRAQNA